MEGHCSTDQSPQWVVVPMEEEVPSYLKPYGNRMLDRDSSVGVGVRYRLDGPGIESRWRRDFPHLFRPALGLIEPPTQFIIHMSKGPGAWR